MMSRSEWYGQLSRQPPVILDLSLRIPSSGKSRDYRDAIVLGKLHLQNIFRFHKNHFAILQFLNTIVATYGSTFCDTFL